MAEQQRIPGKVRHGAALGLGARLDLGQFVVLQRDLEQLLTHTEHDGISPATAGKLGHVLVRRWPGTAPRGAGRAAPARNS